MLLGQSDANDDEFTLENHSVPFFVPMRALADQLLNVDLDVRQQRNHTPVMLMIHCMFVNAAVS